MIIIIGTLGIETVYKYPHDFSLRMMGHGYDIALALAHIQETCVFLSGATPGHFSQFLLMDAQENHFQTRVEDIENLGLAGSLHFSDTDNKLHRHTAYPIYQKGLSETFLYDNFSLGKHIFVEMGFPLEMLMSVINNPQKIPVSLVLRQPTDLTKLEQLKEVIDKVSTTWSLNVPLPEWLPSYVFIDSKGIQVHEHGLDTQYSIESEHFSERPFDIFSLVVAATSAQQISWDMGIDESLADCIPLLESAAPIHIDRQVFAFDRKFTAYFKSVENLEHDHLTGLKNRAASERIIDKLIKNETTFSTFLVDVDHFKSVNDTFGHEAGDMVLSAVAREIQRNLRDDDVGCRWGGEEFVVILPNTGIEAAHKIAERLRECIESLAVNIPRQITASFGVAKHLHQETFKETLERADAALYKAKHNGRNQVIIADEPL